MNFLRGVRAKNNFMSVVYALILGLFTFFATKAPNTFLGILLFLVGVGFVLFLSNMVISKFVVKPLTSFIILAKKISENDLSTEAKFNSKDEYKILEDTINAMILNLRNILQENLEAAEQVAMAAQDMSAMSEEANLSSQEVSNTIDDIARGTEEQSRSVKQSAYAAQQMAETAQQVATEAQKASTLSLQAAERARFGGDIIRDVTSTMVQLKDAVDNSAQVVRRLGLRSTEIGKITDVIRGIARQTNLLALNAAIEAARAGEHGRGFSVVADEVRALAEQSTNSAIQIVELINEIQKETKAAVTAMESGTHAVNKGAELATSANEAFSEILNVVHQTVNTVQEIAAASEEQAASSQEMTSTMEGVAAISDNNAKGSQQVAAATEQQRATMETLAQSSSKLVNMADHLTALVGRFKVISNFQRCWRVMDCNFVDCPAYQSKEEKCWLVSNTLCHEGIPNGSVMEKRSMCHQCDVFKINTSNKGQEKANAV